MQEQYEGLILGECLPEGEALGDTFELDTYSLCLAKRRKMKIIRFNVLFPKRKQGESSWNAKGLIPKLKEVKKTLKASVELKRKGLK